MKQHSQFFNQTQGEKHGQWKLDQVFPCGSQRLNEILFLLELLSSSIYPPFLDIF